MIYYRMKQSERNQRRNDATSSFPRRVKRAKREGVRKDRQFVLWVLSSSTKSFHLVRKNEGKLRQRPMIPHLLSINNGNRKLWGKEFRLKAVSFLHKRKFSFKQIA